MWHHQWESFWTSTFKRKSIKTCVATEILLQLHFTLKFFLVSGGLQVTTESESFSTPMMCVVWDWLLYTEHLSSQRDLSRSRLVLSQIANTPTKNHEIFYSNSTSSPPSNVTWEITKLCNNYSVYVYPSHFIKTFSKMTIRM